MSKNEPYRGPRCITRRSGFSRKSEKSPNEIGEPYKVFHRLVGEDSSFRATLPGKKYGLH